MDILQKFKDLDEEEKKRVVFMTLFGFAVFGFILYMVFNNKKDDSQDESVNEVGFPMMEEKEAYNNKLKAIKDKENQYTNDTLDNFQMFGNNSKEEKISDIDDIDDFEEKPYKEESYSSRSSNNSTNGNLYSGVNMTVKEPKKKYVPIYESNDDDEEETTTTIITNKTNSIKNIQTKTPEIKSNPNDRYPDLPDEILVRLNPLSRIKSGQDISATVNEGFYIKDVFIPPGTLVKGKVTFAGSKVQFNPRLILTREGKFYCDYLAYDKDGDLGFPSASPIPEELMINQVKDNVINGVNVGGIDGYNFTQNTIQSVTNAFKSLATSNNNKEVKLTGTSYYLYLRKKHIEF